ncbi:PD-(D/E)XK motif protein [Micromonospora purpureochromogenes]|nr:PD-(D/E)XK motif protein [Micromonospora purpureochromogenes]
MADRAETIFGLLEQTGVPTDLRVRHSDTRVAAGPVVHGIDSRGRRHLLVPLTEDERAVEDTSSRGVILTTRPLVEASGTSIRYLDVVCELAYLHDLFAVLADEMTERLTADSAQPGFVCLAVLERWRELLSPGTSALLGTEALTGLLAELHFMEELAERDPHAAVRLWTGPDAARADFAGAGASVEVKATSLRERLQVEVHGIGQLEERPGTSLYLRVEQVERDDADGDSVPDAIDRLLNAGADRHALLTKLASLGYRIADSSAYRQVRFGLRQRRTYLVNHPEFPRIVPRSLTHPEVLDHVLRMRYSLDLTAVPGLINTGPVIDHLLGKS